MLPAASYARHDRTTAPSKEHPKPHYISTHREDIEFICMLLGIIVILAGFVCYGIPTCRLYMDAAFSWINHTILSPIIQGVQHVYMQYFSLLHHTMGITAGISHFLIILTAAIASILVIQCVHTLYSAAKCACNTRPPDAPPNPYSSKTLHPPPGQKTCQRKLQPAFESAIQQTSSPTTK